MGRLRISFGSASCKGFSSSDPSLLGACSLVKEKIDYLKTLKKHQLDKWKDAETIEIPVGEKTGILTVFKDTTSDGKDLLIVQAFVPTWKSPNYLSIGLIGRIFAEGFFIDGENNISEASDDDLWPYR